jgi:hypothetical protein
VSRGPTFLEGERRGQVKMRLVDVHEAVLNVG